MPTYAGDEPDPLTHAETTKAVTSVSLPHPLSATLEPAPEAKQSVQQSLSQAVAEDAPDTKPQSLGAYRELDPSFLNDPALVESKVHLLKLDSLSAIPSDTSQVTKLNDKGNPSMSDFDLSSISKAIAGGVAALVVGELARYGFHPSAEVVTAGGVIITGVVSYIVGHAVVWASPANRAKI